MAGPALRLSAWARMSGVLGIVVTTAACDRHVHDRRPGGALTQTDRSFGCEGGTRAMVSGAGGAAMLRLERPGALAPVLTGPLLRPRAREARLDALVAGTPIHLEPVGRYGLTEHLTIGTLSCWR